MGSLFEELEASEAAARVRVEELEAELAALSGTLKLARGAWSGCGSRGRRWPRCSPSWRPRRS